MALRNKKELFSSAEVVDKHLILSLPNALEPIIWRMALGKIGTASFEIKASKKNDAFKLVLKPEKGTAETIASFENKDSALQALLQASDALQKPESNNNQQFTSSPAQGTKASVLSKNKEKNNKKWLYLFLGFLAVIGLYVYMVKSIPKKLSNLNEQQTSSQFVKDPSSPKTGVPLSADDFLNNM